MQQLLTAIVTLIVINLSFAQTITWDGNTVAGGDGLTWEDPLNWDTNTLPKEGDIVIVSSDSVIVSSKVNISRLDLQANAILVQQSPLPDEPVFNIIDGLGNGVIIDGGAKLYIEGIFYINNVSNNGILIEANGSLLPSNTAKLDIQNTLEDGIQSISGATFINNGNILIQDYDGNGMNITGTSVGVTPFYNTGDITILNGNLISSKAAVISASTAINEGTIETYGLFEITSSNSFHNKGPNSSIESRSSLSISCDFINDGEIECLNSFGTSLFLSTNKSLINAGEIKLKIATENLVKMSSSFELQNTIDGSIYLTDQFLGAIPGVYIFDMKDVDTKITNYGLINLAINGKREGIKMGARTSILNGGDFIIEDFIEFGIVAEASTINTNTIQNLGNSLFHIGKGQSNSAIALDFKNRNDLLNDLCSDFIIEDSISIVGISTEVINQGYMELEKIYKNSQATIENSAAMYLADSSLALSTPQPYIDQIENTGLVYHPHKQPITQGVLIDSFFREANFQNYEIVDNDIFVTDGLGGLLNAGDLNTTTNSWLPTIPEATGKDSVFFTFTQPGSCPRNLSMPFISFAPCANASTLTFNGSTSSDWHTASNWTPAQIPSSCDEVIIPDGKHCIINTLSMAFAKLLTVDEGAIFDVEEGANLSVEPEP